MIKQALLFLGFALIGLQAFGQQGDELKDVEIEIVKDREIVLPKASRSFGKIPPVTTAQRSEELEYFFNTINFPLPLLDIRLRPLRIRDPRLPKTYGNYVRGGIGNFGATYLEGYVNSKRNEDYSYGAHVNFENFSKGPVASKNSSSTDMGVEIFGKYFTPAVTFSGQMSFDQQNRKFYGSDAVIEGGSAAEKQAWRNFAIRGGLENTNPDDPVDYEAELSFSSLADKFDARESIFAVNALAGFDITPIFDLRIAGDIYLTGRSGREFDRYSRNLLRINPTVGFEYEGFRIRAGFRGVSENDTIAGFNKFHFYPDVRASYTFNEQIDLYAGIGGDIDMNTLHRFSGENPFLNEDIAVFNSNKTFDFYGGIKGRISSRIGFEAGFSASSYKNLYFFLNDTTAQEKFNVIYDEGSTAVVNIFGSLGYVVEGTWRVNFRGDYWGYGTSDIGEAWHRPNYRLAVTAYYNLFDKINLNGEIYTMGGIRSYDFTEAQVVDLKAFFDLNFMAEYLVSERFSGFLRMNNIFSSNYERYYRYPVRGLQFMIGASYSF